MAAHKEISKFLSYVLRHAPESIGLRLDREGWANIDALVTSAAQHGHSLSRALIAEVCADNDKQRFALSADGSNIRAVQGHSTAAVDIQYQPTTPPPLLFHGTATRFLPAILKQGLLPGQRQYVHLSADPATAATVGARHGKTVVLLVDAARMAAEGRTFFQADNGVWLTVAVPNCYLRQRDDPGY